MTEAVQPFDDAANAIPLKGEGRAILCDFNGTLAVVDPVTQRVNVNIPVLVFLVGAMRFGYEVILHSKSPADNIDLMVPSLMRKNELFAEFIMAQQVLAAAKDVDLIQHKDFTDSSRAFVTLDDENGTVYPSKATHQWTHKDPKMFATLRSWIKELSVVAPGLVPQLSEMAANTPEMAARL